ncbi:Probable pectinesterase/pectinesterase inhibitor 60 [Linum grandiflorum]
MATTTSYFSLIMMRPIIRLLTIFSFFFSFPIASLAQGYTNHSSLLQWCKETPHPTTCNHYTSRISCPHPNGPTKRSEFRTMIVEAALERAIDVERRVYRLRSKAQTHQQRVAWIDCMRLHLSTVRHINHTLQGLRSAPKLCTNLDAQTWLSSSLTNLDTCQLGFTDLNVTEFLNPVVSGSNLSELISNTLAVNHGLLTAEEDEDEEDDEGATFPKWFGNHEGRLLQGRPGLGGDLKGNLVVAGDGSGNFKTVQAAIDFAKRRKYKTRFVIRVKAGVYKENIEVDYDNSYIWLIGDGIRKTIITGDRSVGSGYTTFSSATAGIDGPRFVARGITFRNTAGPKNGQAVALRSTSDLAVFYQCSFEGYQDTLFIHSQRQFFRECYISGTIDFIFGNAAAVFQGCVIAARRPLAGQANMITAQARNDPFQNTGISIHNSKIVPAPDLRPVVRAVKTYLGRPWMLYSRTVVIKTYMDRFIYPAGWSTWLNSNAALGTLYYAEYKNFGPGGLTRYRVRWPGFHALKNDAEASGFTVDGLLAGKSWLPSTGVPFVSGL